MESTADRFERYEAENRRNRVSRRALLRGLGVTMFTVSAGSLLDPTKARAATAPSTTPFGRHLTLGADPTTQMRVAWQTSTSGKVSGTGPNLRLGTSPTALTQVHTAETRQLTTAGAGTSVPNVQFYQHVPLDNLTPATTYYYAVGDDVTASTATAVNSFTTAPASNRPFTFTAFGDQGVTTNGTKNDAVILAQRPAFHLHAGDISYADSSGSGAATDTYTSTVWDDWFTQNESVTKSVPWMIASGNHDMEAIYSPHGYGGLQDRYTLPANGASGCPTTYSFRYGNVAVLSLDANDVSNEIAANKGYSGGAQTSWLGSTLAAYRGDPRVDFIVCFFHHCSYSTITTHYSEGGVRDMFCPAFDRYSVDLVVNGHNHCYERADPIRAGQPTRTAPIFSTVDAAVDGTTYVCAGAGGQGTYAFASPDSYEGHVNDVASVVSKVQQSGGTTSETITWSRVRRTLSSLLALDVVPASTPGGTATMTLRGVDANGTEIDRLTMTRATASAVTPTLPELSQPWLLPVAGVAVAGLATAAWRRTAAGLDVPAEG